MLSKTDIAILAVNHDDSGAYDKLFTFLDSGVSRSAYRCSYDGMVYKVGNPHVNFDEHRAFKWFARHNPDPDRLFFPVTHCWLFGRNRAGVLSMPFFEHEDVKVLTDNSRGFRWCTTHNDRADRCLCPMYGPPQWWSEVTRIFSEMGCGDMVVGRNAFHVDGKLIPIDLGYWGLLDNWGYDRESNKSLPWRRG